MEVLVALVLVAISFIPLILVQTRATSLAISTKNISMATQLARLKLVECEEQVKKKITQASDFSIAGDFLSLGITEFKWECHAPKFNMRPPSASSLEKNLKKEVDDGKSKADQSLAINSSIMEMITNGLGDSVRELAVIIKWQENNIDESVRVVTHVADLNAMARLSFLMGQAGKGKPKTPQEKPNEEKEIEKTKGREK